jgi:hypothetical protein
MLSTHLLSRQSYSMLIALNEDSPCSQPAPSVLALVVLDMLDGAGRRVLKRLLSVFMVSSSGL